MYLTDGHHHHRPHSGGAVCVHALQHDAKRLDWWKLMVFSVFNCFNYFIIFFSFYSFLLPPSGRVLNKSFKLLCPSLWNRQTSDQLIETDFPHCI